MSVKITELTPTIKQIFLYTWEVRKNRFTYSERDVVPSRIKILKKLVYSKNKKGEYSTPDERLDIVSVSYPQYRPFNQLVSHRDVLQRTVSHQYNCVVCIVKDKNKQFSMDSKIVWRVGSFKKYVHKPPQKLIKMIYEDTEEKLKQRFSKSKSYTKGDVLRVTRRWIKKNKRNAPYYSVGDYNAQALGINADNYFRIYPFQYKFDCLYGPPTQIEPSRHPYDTDIKFPFFDKHMLAIIFLLLRKNILKKSNYLEEKVGKKDD